jgi:L-ascorbate metabolism protein UlaG (beta-lactamase superfamily)
MDNDLTFRWLGVAGIELRLGREVLAIDPFFTRPKVLRLLAGRRVRPNVELATRILPSCSALLVTHAHYDHVMDVPAIALHTGVTVYGSENTSALMRILGVPGRQIRQVGVGDQFQCGPFHVEVLPGQHMRIPAEKMFNGPLPEKLRIPLRLSDYRMDKCFSFRVEASGVRVLVGSHPAPADVLFTIPLNPAVNYEQLLPTVQPRLVVPIHWDLMFRPLTRPLRPMLTTAGPRNRLPRRVDLENFRRRTERIQPEAKVLIPEIFRNYRIDDLI